MISLTDDQLSVVMNLAEPLPAADRDQFLRRVASLLRDQVIGDGSVSLAARQAQSEIFRAPDLFGGAGEPKQLRKLQQRAPSAT